MVFDEKFKAVNEASARLYKLADRSELCGSEDMKKDVSYALERLLDNFAEELADLIEQYGEEA